MVVYKIFINLSMKRFFILFMLFVLGTSCSKNAPPLASFTVSPLTGYTYAQFLFDASGSRDGETATESLEFRWDWESDGHWDTDFLKIPTAIHHFSKADNYNVQLEVADEKGLMSQTTQMVIVISGVGSNDSTMIDSRDGRIYRFITIGDQIWMADNLAFLSEVSLPTTLSGTEKHNYVYGYDGTSVTEAKATENYATYGVLYNWPAIMSGAYPSMAIPSGVKGICPDGWHLPSDEEWKVLERYLGMSESDVNNNSSRESGSVGAKLRTRGRFLNTDFMGLVLVRISGLAPQSMPISHGVGALALLESFDKTYQRIWDTRSGA
jgi:uncharacterized protein (TIGR02145 family)